MPLDNFYICLRRKKNTNHPLYFSTWIRLHLATVNVRSTPFPLLLRFPFLFLLCVFPVCIDHFTLVFFLAHHLLLPIFISPFSSPEFPHSIRTWISRRGVFMYSFSVARGATAFPLTSSRAFRSLSLFCTAWIYLSSSRVYTLVPLSVYPHFGSFIPSALSIRLLILRDLLRAFISLRIPRFECISPSA